jgi:hypothetical protein
VNDLFPVELEFVPRQQPRSWHEGLLAELRRQGYHPHMARSPEWGDTEPATALVLWVPPGLHASAAVRLATASANWFRERPVERNRLSPRATIRVVSGRSGHVVTERRLEDLPRSIHEETG